MCIPSGKEDIKLPLFADDVVGSVKVSNMNNLEIKGQPFNVEVNTVWSASISYLEYVDSSGSFSFWAQLPTDAFPGKQRCWFKQFSP